jgi:ribosome biogenesis GTPase
VLRGAPGISEELDVTLVHPLWRLGFDPARQQQLGSISERRGLDLVPARVAVEHRGGYGMIVSPDGDGRSFRMGRLAGRLRRPAAGEDGPLPPAVGDWVAVRPDGDAALIEAVLPRRTVLLRRRAGNAPGQQLVAANVDLVLVVSSWASASTRELSPRRIERYLSLVWASGARPVLVLAKADACADLPQAQERLAEAGPGVPVVITSALTGVGLDALRGLIEPGCTAALIGASGAGKSSLINALVGEDRQVTQAVRLLDQKGRHTTTRRELVEVGEGCLIDSPGMREVGMWESSAGIDRVFGEVEALAEGCRFRDCAHAGEPGCAVRAALEEGELDGERLASYRQLQREDAFHERQGDRRAQAAEKARCKQLHRQQRARSRCDPKLRGD